MSTVIKGDITTMRNNLIREKEEQKKKREEERAILHNARTDSTLYNTKQWKKLRNYYIMNHPLCENCSKYGLVVSSTCVHHKKPFMLGLSEDEQRKLLLDENNLMALCTSCHQLLHKEGIPHDGLLDDVEPLVLHEW